MMDTFGVGAQVRGAIQIVQQASRGTGRTKALIESLHDGDCVVFAEAREADRVKRLAKELGCEIQTIVVPPQQPERVMERGTCQGRLLFDHGWLEQYYLSAVDDAYRAIERLQADMSGYDLRHVETRLKAQEVSRWNWHLPKKGSTP